ncbi:MAG: GHMP kinase [Elusimicrobia bacterium]|nr:GHMP kinase [Elusimicrobiota bacterium]
MIITRTPMRMSLAGGGTDFAEFYRQHGGAVTSMAIDKYIYITVHPRFERTIRVSYSKTEIVNHPDELQHEIVREALKICGIYHGIEIISMADIPANTGLGSSSSFTVGLLHALFAYQGRVLSPARLAQMACRIEIDILKEPIGKQDQYIAAFGGTRHIQFHKDGSVGAPVVKMIPAAKKFLGKNILIFYTGTSRKASDILAEQKRQTPSKTSTLLRLRYIADHVARILRQGKTLPAIGDLLHESWLLKKTLSSNIANSEIDALYERACRAGARGGKILGAGGGGFLMLVTEPQKRSSVRQALRDLRELPWRPEPNGSQVIYRS